MTPQAQPDLLPPPAPPDETAVRDLEALLRAGPLTARQIEGLRPDWASADHRRVRKLASLSPAIVSGPGVLGYALAEASSLADLEEIAARRTAQIRAEGRELVRIRRLIALRRAHLALTQPTQPNP